MSKSAVVLVSGGLDSATVLAMACKKGFKCYALSIDYGQRHRVELEAAKKVADALGAEEHRTAKIDLAAFGGSALTDENIAVPTDGLTEGIPITYVPARNTIMLSLAMAWAEVLSANDIFIGANAIDYSGYPDCRPEYLKAFENMANLATKAAIEGAHLTIHAPLVDLSKAEIIKAGIDLGVDYSMTVSCYQADSLGRGCGLCDSCRLRMEGFKKAGIPDPSKYYSRNNTN